MPEHTFGVVIPAYNRADRINESVESALYQGFDQVIVVDDGSTDETAAVAQRHAGVIVLRQAQQGANVARNAGAALLTTDFAVFLDSDDRFLPTFLQQHRAAARDGAQVIMSGALKGPRHVDDREYLGLEPLGPALGGYLGRFMAGTYSVATSLLADVGGFDEAMPAAQHTELALRLLPEARERGLVVRSIDEPLCVYHSGEKDGIRVDRERVGAGAARLIAKHGDRLRLDSRKLADHAAVAGTSALHGGDARSARRYFWLALRHTPGNHRTWARLALACMPVSIRRGVQRRRQGRSARLFGAEEGQRTR